jgi:hypothetical protein
MAPALSVGDVIQDDARQHVFWLARLRDPELFRGDLIADYWQSLAPPGYTALYWILGTVVDPITGSKLLPPALGVLTALFTFLFVRQLYPLPAASFLAAGLLSWYVWQHADFTSGTSREFLLPFTAAQLWALATGRRALATGLVVLAGLFYPVAGALGVALLGTRLVQFTGWRPKLASQRSSWAMFVVAALLVTAAVVPSQFASLRFGQVVTADQAQQMQDFGPSGRVPFFGQSPYRYWLKSDHSGLGLTAYDAVFKMPILLGYAALAALLPVALLFRRRSTAFQLSGQTTLLVRLLVASFALFFLAHLVLFRLYLPSRYIKYTVPLVLAIAAGLFVAVLIEEIVNRTRWPNKPLLINGLMLLAGVSLVLYPARYEDTFVRDPHPSVTAYLRTQPKDVLIAGVPSETDSVPAFAQRRVLANREHMYPWHLTYHDQLRQRTRELIGAYYSESPSAVAELAARYGVDIFLVNRAAFKEPTFVQAWHGSPYGKWEPFNSSVARLVKNSSRFALLDLAQRCAVVDDGIVAVVPTSCIRDQISSTV